MEFQIYHQLGFRHTWNIDSINTNNTGDGIIVSPKHICPEDVEGLNFPANKTIFDPQFFIPSDSPGKLSEYPFFPNQTVEDFSTESYKPIDVETIAEGCIQFQIDNDFEYIVIPGRPYGNNPQEYIAEQEKCFINPFCAKLSSMPHQQPVILQVIVNNHYLLNTDYFDEILNWVTSLDGIAGIYLIVDADYKTKQIEDTNFLLALLKFINILSEYNGMTVIVGYCNLEALLLTIAGPSVITLGSYENTRRFNVQNFVEEQEDRIIRGPVPRIYMSQLIQLIDYRYKDSIESEFGSEYFDFNEYQATMFEPEYNWHFQKSELYKHFFLVFSIQLHQLSGVSLIERYYQVKDMFQSAIDTFETMESLISFSKESRGDHLPMWLTAANRFAKHKGWIK
jgi:hypothetical protein